MKYAYLTLLAFILFAAQAVAQSNVIVYHENFNGTVTGVAATNFSSVNTSPYTDTLYTAGNYMQTSQTASGTQQLVISKNISTYNLKSLTISWKEYRSQYWRKSNGQQDLATYQANPNYTKVDNTNPITLEYSLDGATFVKVGQYNAGPDFFSWASVNGGTAITLPAAAENKQNVRFRWTIAVDNANTDFYAMDDVMIKGTPITGTSTFAWSNRPLNERPFVASSLTTATPYEVDGVTLRWAQTAIGNGAAVKTDSVKTAYQKKKTFNIIQTGASATAGTEVALYLGKSVSGLTFSILDVDRYAGQFRDKLEIIGYNGTVAVPITKNNILPRYYNEYNSGAVVAKADAVDSKVNSAQGNVTVSFVAEVDKVVIRYYNTDAAKGRQGIAISDISWGFVDVAVAPLPVELASFKGQVQSMATRLTWVTASELNNDRFVVERSQDGRTFSEIGQVRGHGNSSTAITYTFTDTDPAQGTNYYRLRQLDLDGTTSFSHVVALEFVNRQAAAAMLASVYPTVASSEVNVRLSGAALLQVVDAVGQSVVRMNSVTATEVVLPVQNLKSGVYFVTVSNGAQRQTLRFVKL